MPKLLFAVSAGEFLDEILECDFPDMECWIELNPHSNHPWEVWGLF